MSTLKDYKKMSKNELVNLVYNDKVADISDAPDDEVPQPVNGKRVPYIGWFWRSCDFVGKRISIGDAGNYIGVMENNKWDYPERYMTEEEANTFISFLDQAFEARSKSGVLSELITERNSVLEKMREWMQELKV